MGILWLEVAASYTQNFRLLAYLVSAILEL